MRGAGIADSRFTLHYARTTPDGRIALGGGGGRAGFGGWIRAAATPLERVLAVGGGLLLFYAAPWSDAAGVTLFATAVVLHLVRAR